MTTTASYPAASARRTNDAASSRSDGQYSWYHRDASGACAATSSMVVEAAVDTTMVRPTAAAARATARSASGCTIESTPTGASITGAGIVVPSTVVSWARLAGIPRSIRGTRRQRSNAARLAAIVSSPPAPPAT